jgi:hypothetical protein
MGKRMRLLEKALRVHTQLSKEALRAVVLPLTCQRQLQPQPSHTLMNKA